MKPFQTSALRMSGLCATAILLLINGCGQGAPTAKTSAPATSVAVETIQTGPFARILELTGSVEPTRVAALSSPAEGPVLECSVREGDMVHQEQILLKIGRQASAVASLEAAREEAERQERDFRRVSTLVAEKALASEQLDVARSNLERARAALALAEQVSSDYEVQAPWAGVVARVHVADGKYLAPRAPVVDLYDPDSLVLRFRVAEREALAVREGETLTARFDAFPERSFQLIINRAYPELDRQLRMRTFEASLPLQEARFFPGLFARLNLSLETVDSALTVPVESLVLSADGAYSVFRVVDEKAMAASVVPGFEQNGRIWIREGLESGDRIVTRGLELLRDGMPVRVAASESADRN